MAWYLVLISLALFGFSDAGITKRSNRNQNFQHYEVQTFGISNPVSHLGNIIDAISTPLNILSDRLTRQPGTQQFNPGFGPPSNNRGPPGHFGPPGHHHHNHGQHNQQQNNPFHYPPRPLPPYLANLPSREQFNSEPFKLNPQNPFLNKNTTLNSGPGTQGSQGQFPQGPNFFPFGQNYPKPGFSNNPGNANPNANANANSNSNNRGNTGCIGFCLPSQSQPQRPNPFGNNDNSFGGSPNNAQSNNGFGLVQSTFGGFGTDGTPIPQSQPESQFGSGGLNNNNFDSPPSMPQANNGFGMQNRPGTGLIQSTFGGFGTDGSQTSQSQSGNQFGSGGFNNNNFGGPSNTPQTSNGFGTQDMSLQGNGLVQSTFAGFGTDGNPLPQSQPGNQFGTGGFNNNNFGGSSNIPQANNGFGTPNRPSQDGGLIQTTFGGFGSNGNETPQFQPNNAPATQNGQTDRGEVNQLTKPSDDDGLISSIFGEQPATGSNGIPNSQSQTKPQSNSNDSNGLISSIFAGFPENTQTNNNDQTAPSLTESGGSGSNNLIQGVFQGFGTSAPPVNAGNGLQPTTEMSAEMKANNDLIESIFSGINNDKSSGQNINQQDVIGTSTVPPSTTNSNGLIYDIDIRSS